MMTEWKEENERKEKYCTKEKERTAFDGTFDNYANEMQRKKETFRIYYFCVSLFYFSAYKRNAATPKKMNRCLCWC